MKHLLTLLALLAFVSAGAAEKPNTIVIMAEDPGERTGVSAAQPEVLQRLTAQLDNLIQDGRSRPAKQP